MAWEWRGSKLISTDTCRRSPSISVLAGVDWTTEFPEISTEHWINMTTCHYNSQVSRLVKEIESKYIISIKPGKYLMFLQRFMRTQAVKFFEVLTVEKVADAWAEPQIEVSKFPGTWAKSVSHKTAAHVRMHPCTWNSGLEKRITSYRISHTSLKSNCTL